MQACSYLLDRSAASYTSLQLRRRDCEVCIPSSLMRRLLRTRHTRLCATWCPRRSRGLSCQRSSSRCGQITSKELTATLNVAALSVVVRASSSVPPPQTFAPPPTCNYQVLTELEANPKLVHSLGLSAEQLPALVENTPVIAYEVLLRLMRSRHINQYFQVCVAFAICVQLCLLEGTVGFTCVKGLIRADRTTASPPTHTHTH